jgi:glycosyltransferase involved in cell wall biosynthesis
MVARMLSVSVVMFAYNEEENIAFCMEEALEFLASATRDYELILVDDGSSDGTAAAARSVQAGQPDHVQVVSYRPNRGIGGALKAGYAAARKDYITCLPADGQVPPSGLQNLFDVLGDGSRVDLVTCHFPHRFQEADSLFRKVLSRGLRLVLWLATGVGRKMDGVYLIPRAVVQQTVLKSDTFFLNLELPIRAIRSGLTPGEATMHIRPRRAGQSKVLGLGRIWMVFRETVRLGLELRFGIGATPTRGAS